MRGGPSDVGVHEPRKQQLLDPVALIPPLTRVEPTGGAGGHPAVQSHQLLGRFRRHQPSQRHSAVEHQRDLSEKCQQRDANTPILSRAPDRQTDGRTDRRARHIQPFRERPLTRQRRRTVNQNRSSRRSPASSASTSIADASGRCGGIPTAHIH